MAITDVSPASEGDAADQPAAAGTERTIGRSKIRYRTVRGYKSEEGMMNGLGLTQWVWSGVDGLDLGDLIAA